MKVQIIAVGKVKKSWISDGISEYWKRMPELTIVEVKDSYKSKEATEVLAFTKSKHKLIILSEEGVAMTSMQFANFLQQYLSEPLLFVVGGPDGIDESLKQQAFKLLSLSNMTLPHELARLVLVEQLYRAKTILQNGNYHRS